VGQRREQLALGRGITKLVLEVIGLHSVLSPNGPWRSRAGRDKPRRRRRQPETVGSLDLLKLLSGL
jgi:hypothetical protein